MFDIFRTATFPHGFHHRFHPLPTLSDLEKLIFGLKDVAVNNPLAEGSDGDYLAISFGGSKKGEPFRGSPRNLSTVAASCS